MPSVAVAEPADYISAACAEANDQPGTGAADLIDVSVCIVNWNCRDMLRALLQSLDDGLQGVRREVIVVDNASSDGAGDMVAAEFPDVVLIRNAANQGFARANNQAARRACGRFLFFLNNDTVVSPGSMRRLLAFAETHPEAGLIGPRLRGADGEVQVSYRPQPTLAMLLHRTLLLRWSGLWRGSYRRYRREEFVPNQVRAVEILMGAALFTRRERFLAWGGWDEDFTFGGEDLELSVRARRHAQLLFCPEVEILHHGRVSTRQHIGFASTQIAAGMARYLRKTGTPWPGVALYKLAITLDAPLTLAVKGIESVVRWLRGDKARAGKSWLGVRAAWHFLRRGWWTLWRA